MGMILGEGSSLNNACTGISLLAENKLSFHPTFIVAFCCLTLVSEHDPRTIKMVTDKELETLLLQAVTLEATGSIAVQSVR